MLELGVGMTTPPRENITVTQRNGQVPPRDVPPVEGKEILSNFRLNFNVI